MHRRASLRAWFRSCADSPQLTPLRKAAPTHRKRLAVAFRIVRDAPPRRLWSPHEGAGPQALFLCNHVVDADTGIGIHRQFGEGKDGLVDPIGSRRTARGRIRRRPASRESRRSPDPVGATPDTSDATGDYAPLTSRPSCPLGERCGFPSGPASLARATQPEYRRKAEEIKCRQFMLKWMLFYTPCQSQLDSSFQRRQVMPTTRFQAEEIVVTATRRGAQTNAYVISNLPAALNRGMGGIPPSEDDSARRDGSSRTHKSLNGGPGTQCEQETPEPSFPEPFACDERIKPRNNPRINQGCCCQRRPMRAVAGVLHEHEPDPLPPQERIVEPMQDETPLPGREIQLHVTFAPLRPVVAREQVLEPPVRQMAIRAEDRVGGSRGRGLRRNADHEVEFVDDRGLRDVRSEDPHRGDPAEKVRPSVHLGHPAEDPLQHARDPCPRQGPPEGRLGDRLPRRRAVPAQFVRPVRIPHHIARALQPVEHPTSLVLRHPQACHDGRQVPRLRPESPEHLPDLQGRPVPDSCCSIESHTFSSS